MKSQKRKNMVEPIPRFGEKEKLARDLFRIVYDWGRVGVTASDESPTYRKMIKRLIGT